MHPGEGYPSPGITWRAQLPGELQSTLAPGAPAATVPSKGSLPPGPPDWEGLCQDLTQHKPAAEPGTATPQFIAAQGSGCARLLAATQGLCMGSSGHTLAPSPQALTQLSPGFSPRKPCNSL